MVIHHSNPAHAHGGARRTNQRTDHDRRWPTRVRRGVAALMALVSIASMASLVGCASTGEVVAADKPGTFTVAASATGGRMAWARAHAHAIDEARDYCDRRGMQSRVTEESVSGVRVMTEHGSSVNFECHPKF